jgi:hypothetical protein
MFAYIDMTARPVAHVLQLPSILIAGSKLHQCAQRLCILQLA